MDAAEGNGRNAGHAAPAKTHTNYATDFIAATARYASANTEFCIMFMVLTVQCVAIVWGAL